jgi:hypothetical protein
MVEPHVHELRIEFLAVVLGQWAAGVEATAIRQVNGVGRLTLQDHPLAAQARVGHGDDRQQRLRELFGGTIRGTELLRLRGGIGHHFDQNPSSARAVEFSQKDALPRTENQAPAFYQHSL